MHLRNCWSQRLQIWCTGWMCKSQPTDDNLIGAWSGHVTHYKILGAPITSLERLNLNVKFCTRVGYINSNIRMTYHQQNGVVMVTWLFYNFAVCRDAARRAGLSARAELLVTLYVPMETEISTLEKRYKIYNFTLTVSSSAAMLSAVRDDRTNSFLQCVRCVSSNCMVVCNFRRKPSSVYLFNFC